MAHRSPSTITISCRNPPPMLTEVDSPLPNRSLAFKPQLPTPPVRVVDLSTRIPLLLILLTALTRKQPDRRREWQLCISFDHFPARRRRRLHRNTLSRLCVPHHRPRSLSRPLLCATTPLCQSFRQYAALHGDTSSLDRTFAGIIRTSECPTTLRLWSLVLSLHALIRDVAAGRELHAQVRPRST